MFFMFSRTVLFKIENVAMPAKVMPELAYRRKFQLGGGLGALLGRKNRKIDIVNPFNFKTANHHNGVVRKKQIEYKCAEL